MVQGFERREVIQDANKQSRALEPSSVPLTPVMRPQPSSFSKVGGDLRELGRAFESASVLYDRWREKKNNEAILAGEMARAYGEEEADVAKREGVYGQRGWQSMNVKLAQDAFEQEEKAFLADEGRFMSPKEYQDRLMARQKEAMAALPASSKEVRDMLMAGSIDMFPRLVKEHAALFNATNKQQTIDATRKLIVSTSNTDGPEIAQELLDPELYNLNKEDFAKVVANAIQDGYSLGNDNVVRAIQMKFGNERSGAYTSKDYKPILDMIGKAESNNSYTAVNGNLDLPELTKMTLKEVMDWQTQRIEEQRDVPKEKRLTSAAGKYQIVQETLQGLMNNMGLTDDMVFDEALQDAMALELMKEKGVDKFLSGSLSPEEFTKQLSQVWAGIPKDSSGLSTYEGVLSNKATVEYGEVIQSLAGAKEGTDLYSTLSSLGMKPDDINRVFKAKDAYSKEQSSKFEATRLLAEKDIVDMAVDMSDEQLIQEINTVKESGGYTDEWANKVYKSAQTAKAKAAKERAETDKVLSMIANSSVKNGTQKQQQQAIDIITQQALQEFPGATDPNNPNAEQDRLAAMDRVFKFMHENQITDDRMSNQWDVAVLGDIVDKEGRIKPSARAAYSSYRQAQMSTNDPLFAHRLLSNRAKEMFMLADSYLAGDADADIDQALGMASAYLTKQEQEKVMQNIPWWNDPETRTNLTTELVDKVLPGLLDGFYGLGRTQAQMRWELDESSVQQAAQSSDVVARIQQQAAKLWNVRKHWPDQETAQKLTMHEASRDVLSKSEYVAGSFVYTGDQPTIAERIGMGGIHNATNMVVSRIMAEWGPTIYGKDWNNTRHFPKRQEWEKSKIPLVGPLLDSFTDWTAERMAKEAQQVDALLGLPVVLSGPLTSTSRKVQAVTDFSKAFMDGIPDFSVMLNVQGNALHLSPYMDYQRRDTGPVFTLSVDMMKEAASYLNKGDEAGFKAWAESYLDKLPKYEE